MAITKYYITVCHLDLPQYGSRGIYVMTVSNSFFNFFCVMKIDNTVHRLTILAVAGHNTIFGKTWKTLEDSFPPLSYHIFSKIGCQKRLSRNIKEGREWKDAAEISGSSISMRMSLLYSHVVFSCFFIFSFFKFQF